MKIPQLATTVLAVASAVSSLSIPSPRNNKDFIFRREAISVDGVLDALSNGPFDEKLLSHLERRRGGGGSGGGGGRAGGSSSGSGSSGSSGGSAGSRSTGIASSSSAISPSYGGGKYYGGGASTAYRAGGRSPAGITPYILGGAALGIFPGLWLYGAYAYPYNNFYSFHNQSNTTELNGQNETLPVTCLCQMYSACGCDDNNNSTYLDSIVGDGSAAAENNTLINVAPVNGTKTIVLNGTLPNGTDTSAAATSSASSTSAAFRNSMTENSGFWLVGVVVGVTTWLL